MIVDRASLPSSHVRILSDNRNRSLNITPSSSVHQHHIHPCEALIPSYLPASLINDRLGRITPC